MKVGSFGEAFLKAISAKEVQEFIRHYKWIIHGFWDFQLGPQGILLDFQGIGWKHDNS